MSEAEYIAKLAAEAALEPQIVTADDGRQYLVTPDRANVRDVTAPHGAVMILPDVVIASPSILTADSLSAYVNRYKTAASAIFADVMTDRVTAVLDYHNAAVPKGEEDDGAPAGPNHTTHRATLTLKRSEEWNVWSGIDNKLLPQIEFARFLEENGADIAAPAGADVLEACRDLQAVRKVNFKRAVRTASGNESFSYSDETEARTASGEIEIPTKFLLRIPVYFGEAPTELYAFLRWHLDDGELKLGVKLHRKEHVRQAAFKLIAHNIAEATGAPVFIGAVARNDD